jgi:hypothetical protein
MVGDARRTVPLTRPRNLDDFKMRPVDQRWRRSGDGVVGAGKAEHAVRARTMSRAAVGKGGSGAAVVQAQFESRRSVTGRSRQCKTAERDQQALNGNGVGDRDSD